MLLFFIFLCCAIALPVSANEPWWNPDFSCRRKYALEDVPYKPAQADVAVAAFHPYGRLHDSARDVRVLDSENNLIPFQVMFYHPNLYCIVAFRHSPPERNYWIYYGNKDAQKMDFPWTPKAGVFLTTYRKKGGGAPNWEAMTRIFKNSAPHPFGAGYREMIFDGVNPFGPSVDFVSRYLTYFFADKDGEYRFCTASDDASFLLVNEKLVAEWPGWHGAGGGVYGQHSGTIELKKGVHKLTYYHLQGGDQTACVAGWKRPGDKHVSLIPREAFVPILRANCLLYEVRGQSVAPDFKAEQLDSLDKGGHAYVLFQFADITPSAVTDLVQRRWDFGDGVSSMETNPSHLYLTEGVKKVKLVYQMKNGEIAISEQSLPVYGNPPLTNPDPLLLPAKLSQWPVMYPLKSLSLEDLVSAAALLVSESRYEPVFEILDSRFKEIKNPDDPLENELALIYAKLLVERMKQPEMASAFLKKWIDQGKANKKSLARKSPIFFLLAEIQKLHLNNAPEALKTLLALLDADDEMNERDRKKLYALSGDACLVLHDLKRARYFYQQAEVLTEGNRKHPPSFYKSSYLLTVESYIRSGNFKEAENALEKWREDFPTEKINGHSMLLYGKLYRDKKEYASSNKVLEALMENDPSSNLIREALFIQGSNFIALQDYARAAEIFRRLLKQYDDPESRYELQAKLDYCERAANQPSRK